jgi:hypothetical protein
LILLPGGSDQAPNANKEQEKEIAMIGKFFIVAGRHACRGLGRLDRLRQDERLSDRRQWFDPSAG